MKVTYWTAGWCAPCKALKPKVEKLCKDNGIELEVIDIDHQPSRAASAGVMGIPRIGLPSGEMIAPANLPWLKVKQMVLGN